MNHIVSEMNTCYNIPYDIMACMRRGVNENYHKNVTAEKLLSLEISLFTMHRDYLCFLIPIIFCAKSFRKSWEDRQYNDRSNHAGNTLISITNPFRSITIHKKIKSCTLF